MPEPLIRHQIPDEVAQPPSEMVFDYGNARNLPRSESGRGSETRRLCLPCADAGRTTPAPTGICDECLEKTRG